MTSKYAKKVRRLLRKIYPVPQKIEKEVALSKFCKNIQFSKNTMDMMEMYEARLGRMRVDYWVKDQVAVEVHGEQHEMEVKFSNEIEDPEAELIRRKGLDLVKQEVLKESGIPIVIVWYYEIKDLTAELLKTKIMASQEIADEIVPNKVTEAERHGTRPPSRLSKPASGSLLGSKLDRGKRLGGNRNALSLSRSRGKLANSTLGSRPLQKHNKGQSKLSRDWAKYKKKRINNG